MDPGMLLLLAVPGAILSLGGAVMLGANYDGGLLSGWVLFFVLLFAFGTLLGVTSAVAGAIAILYANALRSMDKKVPRWLKAIIIFAYVHIGISYAFYGIWSLMILLP